MNVPEMRSITKQLLRNGKPSIKEYEEALPYCKELYEMYLETNDLWDVLQYANCLKQLGKNNEAEQVCEIIYQEFVGKSISAEQKRPLCIIKNIYAWIIYEQYVKALRNKNYSVNCSFLIDKMIILSDLVYTNEQYAPSFSYCLFHVAKYVIDIGKKEDFEKILPLFDMIDESSLSQEAHRFFDGSGKEREIASEMEDYYVLKSELLLKTNLFEKCISCCSCAMEKISKFHCDNDIWFERRCAQALIALGDIDGAIKKLNRLVVISDKWFLLSEIGYCYCVKKDYKTAMLFLLRAACTKDPEKMKVNLYESIGDVCVIIGDNELAQLNYQIAKEIRKDNGWVVKSRLLQKIKYEQPVTIKNIKKELISKLYFLAGKKEGKLIKLFPRNSGGFIKAGKETYYFHCKNFLEKSEFLKIGNEVCFIVVNSFDKKKQEYSKEASVITIKKE